MIVLALAFCLLFVVIIFAMVTTKMLKLINHHSNKISELRLEIFNLMCDKLRLESENEFLRFQLNKGVRHDEF